MIVTPRIYGQKHKDRWQNAGATWLPGLQYVECSVEKNKTPLKKLLTPKTVYVHGFSQVDHDVLFIVIPI